MIDPDCWEDRHAAELARLEDEALNGMIDDYHMAGEYARRRGLPPEPVPPPVLIEVEIPGRPI